VKGVSGRKYVKETCFGLYHGTELISFSCGGTIGIISFDDPRVQEYIPVATGMYRVYFKS